MNLVDAQWRKSTFSGSNGGCVEVAYVPGAVGVRDTKARDAGSIAFPEPAWQTLIRLLGH